MLRLSKIPGKKEIGKQKKERFGITMKIKHKRDPVKRSESDRLLFSPIYLPIRPVLS